uniref:Apyrase n=1 Tax=Parastrongyloides trichosuri TaxID=131310 RepID=A0A0N4ZHE3_PARTI
MQFLKNTIILLYTIWIATALGGVIEHTLRNVDSFSVSGKAPEGSPFDSVTVEKMPPYDNKPKYKVIKKNGWSQIPFIIISDQDRDAKVTSSDNKTVYASTVEMGILRINSDFSKAKVLMSEKMQNLTTKLNYDGRGAEFSDLKWFDGNLMTVDDKTGVIYKLKGKKLVAQAIMDDGKDGERLYKGEWLTVKDQKMYVGGYGKEFTSGNGTTITNEDPFYIKVYDRKMGKTTVNWKNNFIAVRASIGIVFPAYIVNEAVQWSDIHQKWFFLPRKVSKNPYTDEDAEKAGSNIMIMADENFKTFKRVDVGNKKADQGFSAFQFVPGTKDQLIIALKSKEVENEEVSSYIMVFNINGKVLYGPRQIPGSFKMEGIEFFDWMNEFQPMKSQNFLFPPAPRTTRSLSPQPQKVNKLLTPSYTTFSVKNCEDSSKLSVLEGGSGKLERSNSIVPTRLSISLCPNMTTSQIMSIKKSWKHINTKGLFNVLRRCYQRCQCCCPTVALAFSAERVKKQKNLLSCGVSEHTKYFISLLDRIIDNEPNIEQELRNVGKKHVKLYEEYKLGTADIERLGEIIADVFLKLDGIRQNKETSKSWRILIASIIDEVRVGYENELRLYRRKSAIPVDSNISKNNNHNSNSYLEEHQIYPEGSHTSEITTHHQIGKICKKMEEF